MNLASLKKDLNLFVYFFRSFRHVVNFFIIFINIVTTKCDILRK